MSVGALVYRNVTRRFSTLFLAACFGAFAMNFAFDGLTDAYWDTVSALLIFNYSEFIYKRILGGFGVKKLGKNVCQCLKTMRMSSTSQIPYTLFMRPIPGF